MKKIKDDFPVSKEAISIEFAKLNAQRLKYVAIFTFQLFLLTFGINFYSHFIRKDDSNDLTIYALLYFPLLLLSILMFFFGRSISNAENFTFKKLKRIDTTITLFIWVLLAISCAISIRDQHYYDHVMIYCFFLILCSNAIIVPLKRIWIPLLVFTTILSATMLFDINFQSTGKFNILLILLLTEIMLIFSRINYVIIHQQLAQKITLLEEQKHSSLLTQQLISAAHSDELTTLANRKGYAYFLQSIEEQFPQNLTTFIIDIDFFKNYNDFYGHVSGDVVLKKIGSILKNLCDVENRFAARWGGEEFLIILQDHSTDEIISFYDSFIKDVERNQIHHETSTISELLTFSIGANSSIIYNYDDIKQSIIHADEAQYIVKKSKKDDFIIMQDGKISYCPPSMENYILTTNSAVFFKEEDF